MRLIIPLVLFAASVSAETQSTIVVGNSYSAQTRWGSNGYPALVDSAGHTDNAYEMTHPGASLGLLWQNQSSKYAPAFRTQTWTNLSLQTWASYDSELIHARNFAEAIWGLGPVGPSATMSDPLGISPDARVYVYAHGRDKVAGFDNGDFFKQRDDPTVQGTDMATLDYFEDMALQLRADYPTKEIYVVPTAVVLYEIDKYMEAGLIPGYSDYIDLTRDGGHTNDDGSYVLALAFFATFFGESPVGLPVPGAYSTDPATSAIFQEIAWKVVSRYPLSGVTEGLVVTSFHLPRALEGSAYSAQLESHGATGSVRWSVTSGKLPAGLSLSSSGVLQGTPTENGAFVFDVTATDAHHTDTREMLLFVDSNNPPVITTSSLPDATVGTPYRFSLDATGGVPPYQWTVKDSVIPHGLSLSSSGVLAGTPIDTPPGRYILNALVTDSNPATPVTVEAEFALDIGAPRNGTWILPFGSDSGWNVDGVLDESDWDLAATANHPLIGTSDNDVRFGAVATSEGLYLAADVTDADVFNDSTPLHEDDAVQFFIDALHDRESTFNADDRHIIVTADGRFAERNGRPTGILSATALTVTGYTVEVFVPWSNLDITPETYTSIGFDVAVSDDDNGGPQDATTAWLSAYEENTSPAQFGNLCFWPMIDQQLLQNPEMINRPWNLLKFNDRFVDTGEADIGWLVTTAWLAPFMHRMQNDPIPGWPDPGAIAYGANTNYGAALFQLLHDQKETTGKAYLIFDYRDPVPELEVKVLGYNGTSGQVDAKLDANVREHPIDPGTPDASLLETSPPRAESGWVRYVYEVDLGAGYDYLLIGFSLPNLVGPSTMRIDNVRFGSDGGTELSYDAPAEQEDVSWILDQTTGAEGDAAAFTAYLQRANADSAFALGVQLAHSGTASAEDFSEALPNWFVIPAREASRALQLSPRADLRVEGDESLNLSILPSASVQVGSPGTAALTITDVVSRLAQWLDDRFGGVPSADDPDGNGRSWREEYFIGWSGGEPPDIAPLILPPEQSLPQAVQLDVRSDPAATDLDVAIAVSQNLNQWTTYPISDPAVTLLDEVSHSDGTSTRTYRLSLDEPWDPLFFTRLILEVNE